MSTNSTIAVVHADGKVSQVYVHWDGYLDGVGKMLLEYHNSQELAEAVVKYGSISSLGKFTDPTGPHTFEEPQDDVTVYYGRDRGEDEVDAERFDNLDYYMIQCRREEYNYLFNDGKWVVNYANQKRTNFAEFSGLVNNQ